MRHSCLFFRCYVATYFVGGTTSLILADTLWYSIDKGRQSFFVEFLRTGVFDCLIYKNCENVFCYFQEEKKGGQEKALLVLDCFQEDDEVYGRR